jgi:hypothetical protein
MTEVNISHARWRKSSHSGSHAGECVEVAKVDQAIAMRDSKDPHGPILFLAAEQWHALFQHLRSRA